MQPAKGDHDALRSLGMSLWGEKMATTRAPVLDVLSGLPRLNSWHSGVAQPQRAVLGKLRRIHQRGKTGHPTCWMARRRRAVLDRTPIAPLPYRNLRSGLEPLGTLKNVFLSQREVGRGYRCLFPLPGHSSGLVNAL